MTNPFTDVTLILAKVPAIFGLVTSHVTLATAFGILKVTGKVGLGFTSVRVVDHFLFLDFPRTLQLSYILLLEYSDELLGCGVDLRISVVTLLDANIRPCEIVPGQW